MEAEIQSQASEQRLIGFCLSINVFPCESASCQCYILISHCNCHIASGLNRLYHVLDTHLKGLLVTQYLHRLRIRKINFNRAVLCAGTATGYHSLTKKEYKQTEIWGGFKCCN